MSRRIKEALHINCRKPNLNAQQNHLALAISLQLLSPLSFSVFVCLFIVVVFCVSFSSTVFLISDTNYRYFLLSQLHFAIASSHYSTLCITSFSFYYFFHYLYANYCHLLLFQLHFAITSCLYNTPCNRFYSNYVINIRPRQLL